ncbi:ketopantoate reductase family protein [Halobaculum sp. MBLA0143]|uniref:ketopantoate reductase family protein n=1 Tax=Halobaculum sp. MBLA0143 TaxID=3079933 RepID=UPI003524A359
MEILVFGAGALGSLVGGLLAREHTVTLVGRDPHVAAVRESGLRIEGAAEATVGPDARTDAAGLDTDLAVVTVKAGDVPAAAAALADGSHDTVWSLTNGLTEERLRETLGDRVLAGTATYGAELPEPGVVRCTGLGDLHAGELDDDETESDRARSVADACRAAGVACTATARMDTRRWRKLAVNAGINGVTALARVRNEAVLADPGRPVAARAARETARVARAEGVDLSDETAVDAVREVAAATADNRSSTLQDVRAGRPTEVDAINGAVVRRGETAGVGTPTNRTLWELLAAWATANADTSG